MNAMTMCTAETMTRESIENYGVTGMSGTDELLRCKVRKGTRRRGRSSMRSSVRGGSKVAKGTRGRSSMRSSVRGGSKVKQSRNSPPLLAMGAPGFPFGRSPPLPGPWRVVNLPGRARTGGGRSLWCVRCCWPSYCSAVGHGIKALRGRHHRGNGTR